jgi:hypothetical protein
MAAMAGCSTHEGGYWPEGPFSAAEANPRHLVPNADRGRYGCLLLDDRGCWCRDGRGVFQQGRVGPYEPRDGVACGRRIHSPSPTPRACRGTPG